MSNKSDDFKKDLQDLVDKYQCEIFLADVSDEPWEPDFEIAISFDNGSNIEIICGGIHPSD